MARKRISSGAAGFTLIEVLVALAVLAIGFGFAFKTMSGGVFWLSRSEYDQDMVQVAESLLARVGRDIPLENGIIEGRGEGGFTWRIEMQPYGDTRNIPADQLVGEQVAITVERTLDRYIRRVRLVTLRLGLKGSVL